MPLRLRYNEAWTYPFVLKPKHSIRKLPVFIGHFIWMTSFFIWMTSCILSLWLTSLYLCSVSHGRTGALRERGKKPSSTLEGTVEDNEPDPLGCVPCSHRRPGTPPLSCVTRKCELECRREEDVRTMCWLVIHSCTLSSLLPVMSAGCSPES